MELFESDPVIAPSGDGRLELFAASRQGGELLPAWQAQWSNSSDWVGWCDMGLGVFSPAIGASGDGTLVVVGLNESSQLSYASPTSWSNGWSAWTSLPPVPGGGRVIRASAVVKLAK
jgi:hypothetical protein